MGKLSFLADRTAVLFLGVAAGVAIGYAFASQDQPERQVVVLDEGAKSVPAATGGRPDGDIAATPSEAPPPPAAEPGPPDANTPPTTPAAPPPPPVDPVVQPRQEGVIRIGVFGDSFGDGVWSALYRLLPAKDGYRVVKFSQQSTGFTRYRRLDLQQHDAQQISAQPVEIAVISFGANDAQGVYDGKHGYALMSKGWQQVIGDRIDAYVAMLRSHGAQVYWVGLPKMRDASFDADIAGMNAFYKARMQALGVPFIDIRPLTMDAQGNYAPYMTEEGSGAKKLFRANDGIHMSMNGYIRITKGLAQRIRAATPRPEPNPPAAAGDGA